MVFLRYPPNWDDLTDDQKMVAGRGMADDLIAALRRSGESDADEADDHAEDGVRVAPTTDGETTKDATNGH